MSNWLSKIETIAATCSEADPNLSRMARVIRELAGVAKHGSTVCDSDLVGLYAVSCDGTCAGCMRQKALDNLSPDAKEVIDDLARYSNRQDEGLGI